MDIMHNIFTHSLSTKITMIIIITSGRIPLAAIDCTQRYKKAARAVRREI
jgi:hypothetical protein